MTLATKVSEGAFTALATQDGVTGKYYTFSNEPDLDAPWMAIDYSSPERRNGTFRTELEAIQFLEALGMADSANNAPVSDFPVKEDVGVLVVPEISLSTTEHGQTKAFDIVYDTVDVAPAVPAVEPVEPEPLPRPNMFYSDEALENRIKAEEASYHAIAREFQDVEEEITRLKAEFDEKYGSIIKRGKELKERKVEAAQALRDIAIEYAYRHPSDKQFDTFIAFKDFEDIIIDEVEAFQWARREFPAAIIPPTQERLDMRTLEDLVKSRKRQKQDIPQWAEFKKRTEVHISSKLPADGTGSAI